MPWGTRQLFVYWRLSSTHTAAALQALRAWQRVLREQHPALRTQLYLRRDEAGGEVTVMETYALAGSPTGIDPALQRTIEQRGTAAVQCWLRGARHVEVFDACGEGA